MSPSGLLERLSIGKQARFRRLPRIKEYYMHTSPRSARGIHRTFPLRFVFVVLLWIYVQPTLAQEDEIAAGGRFQYQSHCAVCHGINGTGDGRMVGELLSKPTDLTQLAKNNNGQFPFWKIYRVIDGREEVKAHGPRAMPIWGEWFQVIEGSELRATGRILELIHYLKSIQK